MKVELAQAETPASEMLNALMEQMAQGVIIMNIHADEVQINPEAWALFGKGRSETRDMIISCNMFYKLCEISGQFWPEMNAQEAQAYCEATAMNWESEVPEIVDRLLGSTLCRIQTIVRPEAGLMWILTDISNSQSKQTVPMGRAGEPDLVKRSLEKIKVPMNGVMGMVGLLQRTKLSENQIIFADGIVDAGSALSSIVRNAAEFSALEFGHVSLNLEHFDLGSVVERAVAPYRQAARDKKISVRIDASQKPPNGIVGDPKCIARILDILVGNAIQHTEFGGVKIVQKVMRGGHPQKQTSVISISVTDTGIGLRPAELKLISAQLNSDNYHNCGNANGVGVKLAVVTRLVRLMGGRIAIQSEKLSGTTVSFEIELPYVTSAE